MGIGHTARARGLDDVEDATKKFQCPIARCILYVVNYTHSLHGLFAPGPAFAMDAYAL